MVSRRLRWTAWIACGLTWLCAFVATHVPAGRVPSVGVSDRMLHAVGYFVLGALFLMALASSGLGTVRRAVLALAILSAYAAVDEITQPLVDRSPDPVDWGADVVGALAAAIVIGIVPKAFRRHRDPCPRAGQNALRK